MERLKALTESEIMTLSNVDVNVTGNKVQNFSKGCYICTAIIGVLLIFPLCFLFCDWWKRCVYNIYSVPVEVYSSLSKIFKGKSLLKVSLTVIDNSYDEKKTNILYSGLRGSSVRDFTLINLAGDFDYKSTEHSKFDKLTKIFKTLPNMKTTIRWDEHYM